MTKAALWDKFWKDKDGRVVIWQNPNLPLWTWIACTGLALLINEGQFRDVIGLIGFMALITWAVLEILQGINYFRRFLGLAVLAAIVISGLYSN